MRYQERIYIQDNMGVRNKDILNVNMSSDLCVFESPSFIVSGASKLDCSLNAPSGTSYIISAGTQTIPLTFEFTGNTQTFIDKNPTFKIDIFQYDQSLSAFTNNSIYQSVPVEYSALTSTKISGGTEPTITLDVPISALTLDGEFIIKGSFNFNACTDFLNRLGKTVDTSIYFNGTDYGYYDNNLDWYFIAIREAETPIFTQNTSNTKAVNKLTQQVILPEDGQTTVVIPNGIIGDFILTLNGSVLAKGLDYTFSGNVVTLVGELVSDDTITVTYTTSGGNNLMGDYIEITNPIVSGATDQQGSNQVYFNTTTGKYEVYTSVTPQSGNDIIVMINGRTIANGIDYYQSTSNPKRIILEGIVIVGDIITIIYFPVTSTINGLNTNTPTVSWTIQTPPTQVNGYFKFEVGKDNAFSNIYYTENVDYNIGTTYYDVTFTATGTVGTKLYYRVENIKNYETICGDIVTTTKYSEIIPITIQTNSINSY